MYSLGLSVVLRVLVFSGFVFYVTCQDSRRQCFTIESKTICYFLPNVSSVDWDTAWKTCRGLDATLPVILNEKGQNVFGDYLRKYFSGKPVWTAGRYTDTDNVQWRWLNGQNFAGTDKPSCPRHELDCPHETQAVVTKDLKYGARYPNEMHPFICSYPDINCRNESQMSIKWKGGCLSWNPKNSLPLNKARNECLKGGGDLATFSEDSDLQALQALSSAMTDNDTNEYWIGLHRKWWFWNATNNIQDVKYNLLEEYGNIGKHCLFVDESSKWIQDNCSVTKNVICQAEVSAHNKSGDGPSIVYVVIGIVVAVLATAIVVVILLIYMYKKKRWCFADNKSDPVTSSHISTVQSPDDTYDTIDDNWENLNHGNGLDPSTSYTRVVLGDNPSAPYTKLTNTSALETNASKAVYLEPCYSPGQTSAPVYLEPCDSPGRASVPVYLEPCYSPGQASVPVYLEPCYSPGQTSVPVYLEPCYSPGQTSVPVYLEPCDSPGQTSVPVYLEPCNSPGQTSAPVYLEPCDSPGQASVPVYLEPCYSSGQASAPVYLEPCDSSGQTSVPVYLEPCDSSGQASAPVYLGLL